jgi:hypothetical protein
VVWLVGGWNVAVFSVHAVDGAAFIATTAIFILGVRVSSVALVLGVPSTWRPIVLPVPFTTTCMLTFFVLRAYSAVVHAWMVYSRIYSPLRLLTRSARMRVLERAAAVYGAFPAPTPRERCGAGYQPFEGSRADRWQQPPLTGCVLLTRQRERNARLPFDARFGLQHSGAS